MYDNRGKYFDAYAFNKTFDEYISKQTKKNELNDRVKTDDLDIVEVIMGIEKNYDCFITDEFCGELGILGSNDKKYINPNDLIVSVVRDRKLKELGI